LPPSEIKGLDCRISALQSPLSAHHFLSLLVTGTDKAGPSGSNVPIWIVLFDDKPAVVDGCWIGESATVPEAMIGFIANIPDLEETAEPWVALIVHAEPEQGVICTKINQSEGYLYVELDTTTEGSVRFIGKNDIIYRASNHNILKLQLSGMCYEMLESAGQTTEIVRDNHDNNVFSQAVSKGSTNEPKYGPKHYLYSNNLIAIRSGSSTVNVPIENLVPGMTLAGRGRNYRITSVNRYTQPVQASNNPYLVPKNMFGRDVPSRDTYISGNYRFYYLRQYPSKKYTFQQVDLPGVKYTIRVAEGKYNMYVNNMLTLPITA
jgi:hypothetical protein